MWRGGRQETRNILLAPLGPGRRKGSPSISERQTAKEASLGRTQDQEREQGLEKGTQRRGKECHTNTASCKQELGPLELHCQPVAPLQAAAGGEEKALSPVPRPPPPHGSWVVSATASSRGCSYRVCQQTANLGGSSPTLQSTK